MTEAQLIADKAVQFAIQLVEFGQRKYEAAENTPTDEQAPARARIRYEAAKLLLCLAEQHRSSLPTEE